MFRRTWSSLPKDAKFPADLTSLGYFINDIDEVRNIQNPECYFKYFLNKNTRINDRQRFHFNKALELIAIERLQGEQSMQELRLPLGTPATEPHSLILTSPDLRDRTRVVVIFGEPTQDLAIIAGRVANGPGGMNKGTMVSVVRAIHAQHASDKDDSHPGVVLANMGQRYWWPEGGRALTLASSVDVPMKSLVHTGRKYIPSLNDIPGSQSAAKHLEMVFETVLANLVSKEAKIDIIAIGESCEIVERFLDDQKNWEIWGKRLSAMVLLGGMYTADKFTNEAFKEFLEKRTCSFLRSDEPLNTPLASTTGNAAYSIDALGTPCFSAGEPWYTEMIFVKAIDPILAYLHEVALTPGFYNQPIVVVDRPPPEEVPVTDWEDIPAEERPQMSVADMESVMKQVKEARRWEHFMKTGTAPGSDDEDDEDGVPDVSSSKAGDGDWNDWCV